MSLTSLAAAAMMATASASAPDPGATAYKRCAACHLADGAGVPRSFPPLAGRISPMAANEAGREYLILTVALGVSGPLDVDGIAYRGVMPKQAGLSDADIAAVLNYASTLKPKNAAPAAAKMKPFTATEVAAIRAANVKLTPSAVHARRAGALPAPMEGGR